MNEFRRLTFFFLVVLAVSFAAQNIGWAQTEIPFDVFGDSIENRKIYRYLEEQGGIQVAAQSDDAVTTLHEQLKSAPRFSEFEIDSLTNVGSVTNETLYPHMVKSSLFLGELYNCGRCDRSHASFSGGVVISEDGLALTNHHVLNAKGRDNTEGYMAMTWDGRCFSIEKVIAADESSDIALVQLKADGYKFHAAPIAATRPKPIEPIRIISHPSGEFFVLTTGEVSRYTQMRNQIWMEVTADFARGSSGSGVFNDRGEVVGLVSRIHPIMLDKRKDVGGDDAKKQGNTQPFVEMILKRCVPLHEIHDCFTRQD